MFTHYLTKLSAAPHVNKWKFSCPRSVFGQGFLVSQNCKLEIPVVPRCPSPCVAVSGATQASPPSFAQQMERENTSGKGDQHGSHIGTWAAGVLPVAACLPAAGAVSCYSYRNRTGWGNSEGKVLICVPWTPPNPDEGCVKGNRAVYQALGVICQPSSWFFPNTPQRATRNVRQRRLYCFPFF